jgi:hypothetical protein
VIVVVGKEVMDMKMHFYPVGNHSGAWDIRTGVSGAVTGTPVNSLSI